MTFILINVNVNCECVIQCQILSSWVVMQPHLLAVETRLSSSTSPCSESLSTRLGHTCALLKDKQVEVVSNFLESYDVFGVLRTGYGKSLCFACRHLSVGLSPRKIFSTTWTLQIQNSLPLPVIMVALVRWSCGYPQ